MAGDHKAHTTEHKGQHKGGHHVEHHGDHHADHHHDHHHDIDPRVKGTPLDFSHKHPVFNISLERKGPEFSEIDERRLEYIKKYAGRVEVPEYEVPKNIAGLIPRTGPLPSNRRLWSRPTSSLERNGLMNIHTPNFNTRFLVPFLFGFLLYGWWGHSTYGLYKTRYEDNGELPGNLYDKLNSRVPPVSKIWLRPG